MEVENSERQGVVASHTEASCSSIQQAGSWISVHSFKATTSQHTSFPSTVTILLKALIKECWFYGVFFSQKGTKNRGEASFPNQHMIQYS